MARLRLLAITAASKKVGYAYLEDRQPLHWGMSKKASVSPQLAAHYAHRWIKEFEPEAVVSDKITATSRKRGKTLELLEAIAVAAREAEIVYLTVPRLRRYRNRYEEAASLAARFPRLQPLVPVQPAFWRTESMNLIIFEAIVLGRSVRSDGEGIMEGAATA